MVIYEIYQRCFNRFRKFHLSMVTMTMFYSTAVNVLTMFMMNVMQYVYVNRTSDPISLPMQLFLCLYHIYIWSVPVETQPILTGCAHPGHLSVCYKNFADKLACFSCQVTYNPEIH